MLNEKDPEKTRPKIDDVISFLHQVIIKENLVTRQEYLKNER